MKFYTSSGKFKHYECVGCNKKFYDKKNFKKHEKKRHPELVGLNDEEKYRVANTCKKCERTYSDLKVHILNQAKKGVECQKKVTKIEYPKLITIPDRAEICTECGTKFQNINSHRRHFKIRGYSCKPKTKLELNQEK